MPRRTAEVAAGTRNAVLLAARELFATKGYAATSTADVAVAAGTTRGAVYHHFDDKPALFLVVFESLTAELDVAVRMAAANADGSPKARFLAGSRACLEFMRRPDYLQIAVTDAPAVLGMRKWHTVDSGLGMGSIHLGLQALHHAGELAVEPTPELAVLLFGALTEAGLALGRATLAGHDVPTVDMLIGAFDLILRRLGPPPT